MVGVGSVQPGKEGPGSGQPGKVGSGQNVLDQKEGTPNRQGVRSVMVMGMVVIVQDLHLRRDGVRALHLHN